MTAATARLPRFVYVGAYTGPGKAEGISVYRFDGQHGGLTHVQTATGVESPSFLAFDPQQRFLYSANESGSAGSVSAFAVDHASGQLRLLNTVASHGAAPCYVSVHPGRVPVPPGPSDQWRDREPWTSGGTGNPGQGRAEGRYALVANYTSGSVAVFPLQPDGRLGEASHVVQHQGSGPNQRRQQGPHAHFIAPDPDGSHVLANDLGIDRVMIYRLNQETGKLEPNDPPFAQVDSGAGPRHLAFHPSGRFVYVLNEIGCTLKAFAYDAERGALDILQSESTLPPGGFEGRNSTAQVVMAPSGRFVYASNRGHDSIVIFAVDGETGRLRYVGHEPTQGQTPRNFNIDPTGTFLLAANQNGNSVVSFRVDQQKGTLTATGQVTETPAPVCIVFLT